MKTQVLVTLEFDTDAERMSVLPPRPMIPTPEMVLADLNDQLRAWAHANPYGLRDAEHLSLRLTLTTDAKHGTVEHKLATDLERIAGDVGVLARMVRQVC